MLCFARLSFMRCETRASTFAWSSLSNGTFSVGIRNWALNRTYVTNLTQSAQTVIQVEYNVDKNVSIVAVRDQYGVLGFDVHIRRHKK